MKIYLLWIKMIKYSVRFNRIFILGYSLVSLYHYAVNLGGVNSLISMLMLY